MLNMSIFIFKLIIINYDTRMMNEKKEFSPIKTEFKRNVNKAFWVGK